MFNHTIKGCAGTITVTGKKESLQIQYKVVPEDINNKENNRIERLITTCYKKELPEYTNTSLIEYNQTNNNHTLTIQSITGLMVVNERLLPFMQRLDIFLHYALMDLASLGAHFEIIQSAIREQRQWHWLKEEPNYENLICPE